MGDASCLPRRESSYLKISAGLSGPIIVPDTLDVGTGLN
jgi:hypothetical protein